MPKTARKASTRTKKLTGKSLPRDAGRLVEGYVEHHNDVRLNSAIGYITPKDMLAAHQEQAA